MQVARIQRRVLLSADTDFGWFGGFRLGLTPISGSRLASVAARHQVDGMAPQPEASERHQTIRHGAVAIDRARHADVDREASTVQDVVISGILDIEHAGIEARVIRVQADDDWLTATEIAARVGRSRQSVALLARGERGSGDFPAPAARGSSSNPLWSWVEVEAWFECYEPEAVPAHVPRLSPAFPADVNGRLNLRERLRHSPNAPGVQS